MANARKKATQNSQAEIGLVSCSIDPAGLAEESNRQRIQLIPVGPDGMVVGVDGRSWKFNADAFMAVCAKAKTDFPIDYEHASLDAKKTGAITPAAGWIDPATIEIVENSPWGEVEWTDRAANMIRAREMRYTSPVFPFRKATGEIVGFIGSALTHYPNLGDQHPVANAQDTQEEFAMELDELMERFIYMLNLPVTATPDEVKAELQKVINLLSAPVAANAQLGDDPRLTDVVTAVLARLAETEQAANARSDIDLSAYVPRGEFNRVSDRLKALEKEGEDKRVETAVNAAIDTGIIAPASRQWAEDYCRKDPDGFAAFASNAAKVVPLGEEGDHGNAANPRLSQEEMAVCNQMGIDPADYAESKKSEVN